MTAKRVRVPAALHAELTDYTNLVRALRTTHTLDLTAHLLRHAAADCGNDNDTWSAWPLIDCAVPEWTLHDEVKHIAEFVARQHLPLRNDHNIDCDSDLDAMPHTAANLIVLHTASLLVRILSLLADQRPSAPGSMQNRLRPMNWEDVISLLAVAGLVDPTVVARAEKRLERVYGPSNTKAFQRLELVNAAKTRFSKLACMHEDQLFAPPTLHSRTRRKHSNGLRRSRHAGPNVIEDSVTDNLF